MAPTFQPDAYSSNASQSPPETGLPRKRASSDAGVDETGKKKTVKRRATKACAACRARKVRCDVMQNFHFGLNGQPLCSNCNMDKIPCVIEESKRRKKHFPPHEAQPPQPAPVQAWGNGMVNSTNIADPEARRWSASTTSGVGEDFNTAHVPHPIYQDASNQFNRTATFRSPRFLNGGFDGKEMGDTLLAVASLHGDRMRTQIAEPVQPPVPKLKHVLPPYLKPLPPRMTSVDIDYLWVKGALSLPDDQVRNALLHVYVEYVHPYMPVVEIHELLSIIDDGSGTTEKLSLLLFQAIMFAGTAFVDMEFLRQMGYTTRKSARKAFFQKARVLYDFDYEVDRVALVQSLLLMTYWYETPDDQKDTWHWMGVAISLAHTVGLHRDPDNSSMASNKKKLWKRIWWSLFMRDRLVALGMRRPTRVKDEDYDVPMLKQSDFEIEALSEDNTIIPVNSVLRDQKSQIKLAEMCIAKAKLCLCIGHVLAAQYSVLVRHQGMAQNVVHASNQGIMLFPKKIHQADEVRRCDVELSNWVNELPPSCVYSDEIYCENSAPTVSVQSSLLHMVYFTTLSALHRPQVLPSSGSNQLDSSRELQDFSRSKVREASREITRISKDLHIRNLEKYLPTTGVTVLLPAIIIHLLDIKSSNDEARQLAMEGFTECLQVLEKLRDNYSSADFATQFLEAAIRKANIMTVVGTDRNIQSDGNNKLIRDRAQYPKQETPPPEQSQVHMPASAPQTMDYDTPPDTNSTPSLSAPYLGNRVEYSGCHDPVNLEDYLDFDGDNDFWSTHLEEGGMHGEFGGTLIEEFDWLQQPAGLTASRLNSPGPDGDIYM